MSKIFVLHENHAWTGPLFDALAERDLPVADWHFDEGVVDLDATPPEGVFYNRISASSHTRDHRFAPELTRNALLWLEAHGRRVVNDSRAVALEVNKLAQYAGLRAQGVTTPRTTLAVGREHALQAAKAFSRAPFILKPNRGGAGAGVKLVTGRDELAAILDDPTTERPLDGAWLIQQYIRAPEPLVTRCEFIGGRFHYAVRVNTSAGFELCPADACALPDGRERFEILDDFDDPLLGRYAAFARANGVEVMGVEFIRDEAGRAYTYDVNTNTNYNSDAEQRAAARTGAEISGMGRLAGFLGELLGEERRRAAA